MPVVVARTGVASDSWAGGASFDVSAAGTLVFARGSTWENQLLTVVDRTGATLQQIGGPLSTDTISLSRDGSTVAVDEFRPDNADVYSYDV